MRYKHNNHYQVLIKIFVITFIAVFAQAQDFDSNPFGQEGGDDFGMPAQPSPQPSQMNSGDGGGVGGDGGGAPSSGGRFSGGRDRSAGGDSGKIQAKLSPKTREKFSKAEPEDISDKEFPEIIESFDYSNAEIADIVKAISELTGKNFIVDPSANKAKITIIAPSQITVAEAYKAFLSALAYNKLTVVPSGKFLKIMNAKQAIKSSIPTYSGKYFPNSDQMVTRIFQIKHISAEEIEKRFKSLISENGEMIIYPPTNSVILSDLGSSVEKLARIFSQLDVPGFDESMEVLRVNHANAKDMAGLIDKIINKDSKGSNNMGGFGGVPRFNQSKGGSGSEVFSLVLPYEPANSLIVVGNKAGINKVRKLIARLDIPLRPEDAGGVYVYYVKYGEAEQIANTLNGIASEAKKNTPSGANQNPFGAPGFPSASSTDSGRSFLGGNVKLSADKNTNSLIITGSKQDFESVKSILKRIDVAKEQVYVEAVILEMGLAATSSFGINYYKFAPGTQGMGRVGFRSSTDINALVNPASDSGLILGFGQGEKTTINIGTTPIEVPNLLTFFQVLKANTDVNILSTPQILATNNEESEIEVGDEVAIGTTTTVSTTGTTQNIERKPATITLTLTPYLNPTDDMVRIKVKQSIIQLSAAPVSAKNLADSTLNTSKRAIKTQVTVKSGNTVVLGGLMTEKESEEVTKVPLLGDIPILGWLFKGKRSTKSKVNLLVFLTPKILRNEKDSSKLLSKKLDERIEFIKNHAGGRDPFGKKADELSKSGIKKTQQAKHESSNSDTTDQKNKKVIKTSENQKPNKDVTQETKKEDSKNNTNSDKEIKNDESQSPFPKGKGLKSDL